MRDGPGVRPPTLLFGPVIVTTTFEFALATPLEDVGMKGTAIVMQPELRSAMEAGNELPMLVKLRVG